MAQRLTNADFARPSRMWLENRGSRIAEYPIRPTYIYGQLGLMFAINKSPSWQDWWSTQAKAVLALNIWQTPEPEDFQFAVSKREVVLDYYVDGRVLESTDRRLLLSTAHNDLLQGLSVAASQLNLASPPPAPSFEVVPPSISLDEPEDETWDDSSLDFDSDEDPWFSWTVMEAQWN